MPKMSKNKEEKRDENVEEDDLSSESSSDDDDSLVLEGVLVRNPDVSSSSDDDDEDEDNDDDDSDEEADGKEGDGTKGKTKKDTKPAASTSKSASTSTTKEDSKPGSKRKSDEAANDKSPAKSSKKKKKKKKEKDEIDMIHVDFIFCDMAEKYWGGIKALLINGSSLYQAHSSILADQMIEHEMVGTVIATENDPEDSVFGFGSLLHWAHLATAQDAFLQVCQQEVYRPKNMPVLADEQATRQSVVKALQTKDNPSVAFLLFGRMINLPLEIVLALHQQLWLDIEWAQKQKDADELSYSQLNMVLRLAPCTREANSNNDWIYRYFDDEIMAGQAVGKYVVEAPKSFSREDKAYLQVLVLDLKGYQQSIKDLERMVGSGS